MGNSKSFVWSSFLAIYSCMSQSSPLEQTYCFRYLGIIITPDLSWAMHIEAMFSKCKLYWVEYIQKLLPAHTSCCSSEPLYLSIVLPHLTYCSSVRDPPTSANIAKGLEKTKNCTMGLYSYSPLERVLGQSIATK